MMPFLIVPSARSSSHLHAGPVESAVNLFIPGRLLIALDGPPSMAVPFL